MTERADRLIAGDDERMVLESVRRFADQVLRPEAPERDRAARPPDDAVRAELASMGLLGLCAPESCGGSGFGWEVAAAVVEALARADAAVAWLVGAHNAVVGAVASSGVDVGSAVGGERWAVAAARVRGPGRWADVPRVEAGWLGAVTPDGWQWAAPEEWSFLDPVSEDGSLGLRCLRWTDVSVRRCSGSDEPSGRLRAVAGAVALGLGEEALDVSVRFGRERRQFGRPLTDFQATQWKVADRATELEVARLLLRDASAGGPVSLAEAATRCARAGVHAAYDAVQMFGGSGFVREYPPERLLRDALDVQGRLCTTVEAER
jgi:hypothetical protein